MLGRLLTRLALLAAPFAFLAGVVLAVDPYDRVGSHLIGDDVKLRSAAALNPVLWSLSRYKADPRRFVLLGDSRMGNVSADSVSARVGVPVANLAFGGSSLDEVISAFWIADALVALTNVDIAVGFSQYSDYDHTDRTALYRTLESQPLLYLVSRSVLRATTMTIQAAARKAAPPPGHPAKLEAFWAAQHDAYADRSYRVYKHPDQYRADLARIAARCRERRIHLRFIVFPTFTSLRGRLAPFHLESEFERFKRELGEIAPTIDFDFDNALTTERANFVDPVHVTGVVNRRLVDEIWGGKHGVGRMIGG